jgi:hypothetical protein
MTENEPKYIDIDNFAAYLNVSRDTIEDWIDRAVLSHKSYFKIFGLTRIELSNALRELHEFSSSERVSDEEHEKDYTANTLNSIEPQSSNLETAHYTEQQATDLVREHEDKKIDTRRINRKLYELAHEEEGTVEFDGLDFNEGLDFEDTSIYQVAEAVSEYQYEKDYTDRPVKVGDTVYICFYDDSGENLGDQKKFELVQNDNVKKGQISVKSPFGKELLNAVPMEFYKYEESGQIREFLLVDVR